MKRAGNVEEYFVQHAEWREMLEALRGVLAQSELAETIKWGAPCYTLDGKNVVGIGAFKNHCGLWFFQGVHLNDANKVLVNAQEDVTQALRQWRFEAGDRVPAAQVKAYVREAIENQRKGLALAPRRKTTPVEIPPELQQMLSSDRHLAAAFDALSPGKQRDYATHLASAKRAATRESRLAKILPMIRAGQGLHDKYRC